MSDGWEVESLFLLIMSPLIGVLAEVLGCAMLGGRAYRPLYIAARQGAIGGPVAAIISIFISATMIDEDMLSDDEYRLAVEAGDIIHSRWRRRVDVQVNRARGWWSYISPYAICVAGPPIGSAIMHATKLSYAIDALHAVRAGSLGGIIAVPLYFITVFAWIALAKRLATI